MVALSYNEDSRIIRIHQADRGAGTHGVALAAVQKVAPDGTPAASAHPARFSPDDKFSKERITTKKRFNLLPTQQPAHAL